jgi:hypothetical protein
MYKHQQNKNTMETKPEIITGTIYFLKILKSKNKLPQTGIQGYVASYDYNSLALSARGRSATMSMVEKMICHSIVFGLF